MINAAKMISLLAVAMCSTASVYAFYVAFKYNVGESYVNGIFMLGLALLNAFIYIENRNK
jgi:hypothetical protein